MPSDFEAKARGILSLARQNAGHEGSKRMVEIITTALRAAADDARREEREANMAACRDLISELSASGPPHSAVLIQTEIQAIKTVMREIAARADAGQEGEA